ncbi:MAG TPA: PQQ-binding-like beta-propeller repeat protein, partial [Terriglobia bacterium]|nr:PQQ-binding-like beta-propeller repeat protein [Terriglobia bacterium]
MRRSIVKKIGLVFTGTLLLLTQTGTGQRGSAVGEWRHYGGDAGGTKYSPLDQINASNVSKLQIAWRWKTSTLGPPVDSNWEVTPLMIGSTVYFTAGSMRAAVAVDAASGDTKWIYRLDEGTRGSRAPRINNRGLAYWSDNAGNERIILITPGYQMVALNAKSGKTIPEFGTGGIVDLWNGLGREVQPNQIGSSSPAIIVGDVVVMGAALLGGNSPPTMNNVPGYI